MPPIDRRDFITWLGATAAVAGTARAHAADLQPTPLYAITPGGGSVPNGAPCVGGDGALYGTFMHGGSGGLGLLYRLTLEGTYTELAGLVYQQGLGVSASSPCSLAEDGALWSSTMFGGAPGNGTLMRWSAADGLRFLLPGGGEPGAPALLRARLQLDGPWLYGLADSRVGGGGSCLYRSRLVHPRRTEVLFEPDVHSTGACRSGPLRLPDGTLVFTTTRVLDRGGALLRLDPRRGSVELLHAWRSSAPRGELLLDAEGWLWGVVTAHRGRHLGQVWRFHLQRRRMQRVHAFTGGEDGAYPCGGLTRHADGSLWGLTNGGGDPVMPRGTVYRIGVDGGYAVVHRFSEGDPCGYSPLEALCAAPDGSMVGTTDSGGAHGLGAFFRLAY
ncbi:hypothetical protein KAK06_00375 [Ideonella sp. 4Y11]|uniref:Uncharacterized protein n=1 Tax=Ideonella aquatica TaxID=2824119 RepID=A0A940YJX6_9BURK|nr:choice-of-anchor tandem repeat GloVer-containing protein [Ideonella aquatica]MBQ0957398.1 hypothetical protein [Ideonella aquatica]